MGVEWENYVWDKVVPAVPDDINRVESEWNISFPEDYRSCVIVNQGRKPVPNKFRVSDKESSVFNDLLHFRSESRSSSIMFTYERIKDGLPEKVYPFASDPGGNKICFDYRNSSTDPKIVFWDHEVEGEKAIVFLANSFTEFLDSLY